MEPSPLLLLGLIWAAPGPDVAPGPFVRVSSGSLVQGDQVLAADGRVVPRRRLVQRLGLLARPGDPESPWSFQADLRIAVDAGLDRAGMRPEGVEARQVDLRHATLAGRGLLDGRADLVLGRQYRWDVADLLAFDGAHAAVEAPWMAGPLGGGLGRLGIEAYGGLVVRRDASWLGASDLDPDGRVSTEEQTPTAGAGVLLRGGSLLRGRVGWRGAWRGGDPVRELVSASLLGGPRWGLAPDVLARYDVHLRRPERTEAGVAWALPGDLGLEVEGRAGRVRPAFDADSIWPYFSDGPSDDAAAAVRWRGGPAAAGWGGWLRGGRRWFEAAGAPAAPVADEAAGGVDGPAGPRGVFGASARRRAGHGGNWTSVMVHGAWAAVPGLAPGAAALELEGLVRWSRFDADLLTGLAGDTAEVVAGVGWSLTRAARFHVSAEADLTPWAAPSLRAFGLLDLSWAL